MRSCTSASSRSPFRQLLISRIACARCHSVSRLVVWRCSTSSASNSAHDEAERGSAIRASSVPTRSTNSAKPPHGPCVAGVDAAHRQRGAEPLAVGSVGRNQQQQSTDPGLGGALREAGQAVSCALRGVDGPSGYCPAHAGRLSS